MDEPFVRAQAARFTLKGAPVSCARYGSGHINDTFLVYDPAGAPYILQRLNTFVFKNPEALMENVSAVTGHLRRKVSAREALTLVPAADGRPYAMDEDGGYWRMYLFVTDSLCLERAETDDDFRESGAAFGAFQRALSDFPAATLHETIPRFHDTPDRYRLLRAALEADTAGRAASVQAEVAFALEREVYARTLVDLQRRGELPARVTHNDTKLNNVLLDAATRRSLCVVDLDTVMPGLSVNDYGDSIRFGASTAAEDETDLDCVRLDLKLLAAYTEGFLSRCGQSLTGEERRRLRDGAKMMTLECGVRFLTDFLSGDVYFKTARPSHNLDRCRTQFKLVAEMERHWNAMEAIVEKALGTAP